MKVLYNLNIPHVSQIFDRKKGLYWRSGSEPQLEESFLDK